MLTMPQKVTCVAHPLIASVYLKKEYGFAHKPESVLVIETNFPQDEDDDIGSDSYMSQLLGDLRQLKSEAEKKVGHFDRIDIRNAA